MSSSMDGLFTLDGAESLGASRGEPTAPTVHPLVLVAEHDGESRERMTMALAAAGYDTAQVPDGAAALNVLSDTKAPAVLVAEEELPEFGGFQLAELLSLAYDAPVRFGAIVLTASLGEALRQPRQPGRCQPEAVPLEVLVKPFHTSELLLAVGLAADRITTARMQSAGQRAM